MCICINCRHIHLCKTYEFIKKQHNNNKINKKHNGFIPINTIIVVNINKHDLNIYLDWDLKECSSFIEQPGKWLSLL
uniref:hypothetical protein n=1 Tax=Pterosiphonia complanata TaxID=884089 RepID=UPI0022FD6577|nr:hypothetical protein PNW47_pgp126 [Pterosiphonia complanata]WAX03069.1 hypothetical protein [Pterosiphonia complanata]